MTVANKSHISDIQNSILSSLEVDAACHHPKYLVNFVPVPHLKAFTME
jgi:hypothetical protein